MSSDNHDLKYEATTMFKPTLAQQEIIDNSADKIHKLAKKMWEDVNEIEYEPTHPDWDSFDDPIKDEFISAASYIYVCIG